MEIVGIPKEIKPNEKRVGLTPVGVQALCKIGSKVLVETGAGVGAGCSDEAYRLAGAEVVDQAARIWREASVIQKVKEPLPTEYNYFQKNKVLFCYLHLASHEQCELVRALVKSGITAIGYETVEVGEATPLLKPMSLVAGTLAAYYAGLFRNLATVSGNAAKISENTRALMNQMAERYPDVPKGFLPGKVFILGGGQAGLAAAEMVARMGGAVRLTELDAKRRQFLTVYFKEADLPILLRDPKESDVQELLTESDVIIASVHRAGNRAPLIISKDLLSAISQRKKKLIIDISIDQGGNIFESHSTSYDNPLYLDSFGNVRFAVSNMPSICPKQASKALEEATLKYSLALAGGLESAVEKFPELLAGINIQNGQIKNEPVGKAHQYFS